MFESRDFKGMKFDPTTKKDMTDAYPVLGEAIVLWGGSPEFLDQSLRFVSLMYDEASPLRSRFAEIEKRKEFALDMAGIKPDTKIYKAWLTLDWDWMSELIVLYMRLVNNRLWTLIVTNEEAFYEYSARVLQPISTTSATASDKDILQAATVKSKLMDDMDKINERLSNYYRQLSGEDEAMSSAVQKRRAVSPERIGKRKGDDE
jgi:hypothetical protein